MSDSADTHRTKFHALLHDQIRNEFNASHQYIATAVFFDNADLPQLAKHFYSQAVEERNHAMMIVQYFLDRDMTVELSGVDASKSYFENTREPIALALKQEQVVTEQIIQLASTAREEGDYLGEQFMQWFLKEQVEEVASMTTLLAIADRAGDNLFHLEDFVAREMNSVGDTAGAPPAAGGSI
ncbi:ferritin BfrB [Rhodococcus sp. MTM3W5.2]|uniref:ferritin n=1 Tax=Rhodococcus sp. MTM3W5.2 TaxID=1805827 RepID=UPI00097906AE|nr:ferritin [Rhodococcus sp. MTM3W5.2]AQA22983.1 ferritin BfrB [Rhodococcus sp. MTM3W5.2]